MCVIDFSYTADNHGFQLAHLVGYPADLYWLDIRRRCGSNLYCRDTILIESVLNQPGNIRSQYHQVKLILHFWKISKVSLSCILYFLVFCILILTLQISHHPPEELSCASHRTLGGDVGSTPGDAKCNVHNFLYLKVNL